MKIDPTFSNATVLALVRLEKLAPGYELTLFARNKANPKAHVIISAEEPETRFEVIRKALGELESNGTEIPNR